jgi:hypothetical protein
MKMFDRSTLARLGFLVVTLFFMSFTGNAVKAADEEHGNPGQFVENIRKGLSGISKFFWSPKEQALAAQKTEKPVEEKSPEVSAKPNKPVTAKKADAVNKTKSVSKSDTPPKKPVEAVKASKPVVAKTATKEPQSKVTAKQAVKQQKQPAPVVVSGPKSSPKTKASAKSETLNKAKATEKAKQPSSPVALAASEALADKTKKSNETTKLKKDLNAALVRNKTVKVEKQASAASPAKAPKAIIAKPAPAGSADHKDNVTSSKKVKQPTGEKISKAMVSKKKASLKDKAVVPAEKKAVSQKPVVKKQASIGSAQKLQDKKPAKTGKAKADNKKMTSRGSTTAPVVSSTKTVQKKVANNSNKGTYIWLPNIGSKLGSQFGSTGILADKLAANNDLNRIDGRWVFVPYRSGTLPSLYGMSDRIRAAGTAGVWVGSGQKWVYVFDKKRTYRSFFEDVASVKTKSSTSPKSDKGANTKKAVVAPKKTPETVSKPVKTAKSEASKQAPVVAEKPASIDGKGKATPKIQARADAMKNANAEAKAPSGDKIKTAKSGNWSKVNSRWVYVPDSPNAKSNAPSMPGLAEQVSKAPAMGGWVQRNNRWVYIAPKNKTAGIGNPTGNPADVKKGAAPKSVKGKVAAKVKTKEASKTPGITIVPKDKVQTKPVKQAQAAKIPSAKVQAVKPKTAPAKKAAAARSGPTKKTDNQRVWVREKNSWVYTKGKSTPPSKQAGKKGVPVSRGLTAMGQPANSQARKNTGVRPTGKTAKPAREFFFFVPGRIPGTGSWFAAPVDVMKKARKLQNPTRANRR